MMSRRFTSFRLHRGGNDEVVVSYVIKLADKLIWMLWVHVVFLKVMFALDVSSLPVVWNYETK